MNLDTQDAELFFRLNHELMYFVNQRLKILPEDAGSAILFGTLSPDLQVKVRDAFLNHRELLTAFVEENPAGLDAEELETIRSWQHLVTGKFFVYRYLAKHAVFLTTTKPAVAYGVVALHEPLEAVVCARLPVMVEAVLLPFKGRIIYDGLMKRFSISFGGGIRRGLDETYREAKAEQGIITCLTGTPPIPERVRPPKPPATSRAKARPAVKEEVAEVLATITGQIDTFCRRHLNSEYATVCRKLAEKLSRKRPSPLLQGQPSTWASGIVRTIGMVNFLGDSSQTPHMKMTEIDEGFGVSPAAGAAKAKAIRELLKIHQLEPEWTLPSKVDSNPMIWMLNVNGFMMDIRYAPRDVQEAAFRKGLIPYIPADRTPS